MLCYTIPYNITPRSSACRCSSGRRRPGRPARSRPIICLLCRIVVDCLFYEYVKTYKNLRRNVAYEKDI